MSERELQARVNELEAVVVKCRDLIGDQRGDTTGAALDAWVILCAAASVGKTATK
jgi:hypothetical protein